TYTGLVDVDLSTDSGSTWQSLVEGSPNDGSVVVTIPDTPGATMRVQVSAADGDPTVAGTPADISDRDFAISVAAFVGRDPGIAVGGYGALVSGDFDGDGVLDLIVAGVGDTTLLYHGDGQGDFTPRECGIVGVD